MSDLSAALRQLPSVDRLLSDPALSELRARLPHDLCVAAVRDALAQARAEIQAGRNPVPTAETLARQTAATLERRYGRSLRSVVNATGVVIHTNLGRAPLSQAATQAMTQAAAAYSNLEFELSTGTRGSRATHLDSLLTAATGAEAGIAVNNNAAALYFVMSVFAAGRDLIVSRGQAVEIGGGFRIPDVIRQSGARLVEVGTTNRTRAQDYRDALSDETAALLRVHSSNFRIIGFVEETTVAELRAVADDHETQTASPPLLIDDVGSGCLLDTRNYGLAYEPRPQDSVAAGADLVLFSGDKLLGGPQAGIIVGRESAIAPLRRHPLMRALRPDKTTIAGLAATLEHYLAGEAETQIPIWQMIAAEPATLRKRAESWQATLGAGQVSQSESAIGGGSLPGETRPTWVWSIRREHPSKFAEALRRSNPPVIARVTDDQILLDPRTVLPGQDQLVIAALRAALGEVA